MRRLLSAASLAGLAGAVFLLVLAALRWAPVYAEPPWDVRALPLAGPALLLAIVAALTGRERRPRPVRPLVLALGSVAGALALAVWLRPPGGLVAEVSDPRGVLARLPPGPVELVGGDLQFLPHVRKWTIRWAGPLRVSESGAYGIWADGRGAVEVRVDGRAVLHAEGERLRAGVELALGRGEHRLEVQLERIGPGPRLRLGWRGPHEREEAIPPRALGPPTSPILWRLTDLLALAAAALVAALVLAVPWDRPRRPPAPRPVTRVEVGLSLAAHAALVALMSWPLLLHPFRSGVVDRPDGRLNAWILAWDVHALRHDPARLFQAPIFHPLPDALAFSENLLLPAILASPAISMGGPVLGYNLILAVSHLLSGLGVQLLVRRASGDRLAAFVGGAFFAVGAHRWVNMAHLHAQVTLFLPLALLALDRFWEKRSLGRSLLVGALLAFQALSSIYLGAITATVLVAATALAVLAGLRPRDLLRLAAGFLLAGALLYPVARPYLRMRYFQGMEFTLEQLSRFSTTLESYAASGAPLYGPLTQRHLDPQRVKDPLFPGLAPLVLGVAGLAAAPRRYRAVALATSALAVVLSLGPETALYRFLHEHVVLFRGIRALGRFSVVPALGLSVLAGFALAGRWRVALAALALFVVESRSFPIGYGAYGPPAATAQWLAWRPGAVAYLPLGTRDTEVMLDAIAHFRPLLNGDSGFVPRPYDRERELLAGPLSEDALRFLRAVGVRQVVTTDVRDLPLATRIGDDRVYEIPPGESAHVVSPGDAGPTRWTGDGPVVDLGRPRTVGRVVFELADSPWVERPEVRLSVDGAAWHVVEAHASLADATLSLTKDPRGGLGEIRFPPEPVRSIRLDPRLPARRGILQVGP